jgi:hypothetical protein
LPPLANFCIVQTLFFGACERLLGHQNALPLISLSRAAEPQHDGAQWRIIRRPARDAGISGRNVREMPEVCAIDAKSPRTFLPEQVPFEQLTAALIALRVPSAHKLENQNVLAGHDDILAARNASGNHEMFYAVPLARTIRTIEAEYISDEKVLRLAEPLAGVRNHEKVRVIIDDSRPPEPDDWPTLSEEAGRELARAVREAFGRDDITV